MTRIFWLVALVAALGLAPAARAQVRASDDMPVTVRLEIAPDPPLRVSGGELSFGTVRIPNRLKAGSVCTYNMNVGGDVVAYDTANPGQSSTTVTPSGCLQTQRGSLGIFAIFCEHGRNVKYTITQSSSSTPNLSFTLGQIRSNSGLGVDPRSGGETCNGGLIQLRVGGVLSVGQDYTLPVGQALQLANLIINVEYS